MQWFGTLDRWLGVAAIVTAVGVEAPGPTIAAAAGPTSGWPVAVGLAIREEGGTQLEVRKLGSIEL
jgi:hypothetical protein